ncbi:hypothetical protein 2 [Wenling sobemo-like virus 2]|uniref:hypothetical protein 2 n=1 Tax=Wenling sobemo-like virus 2 TaxID=1923541 RepID=UPI00090ABDC6|nr:hypothetical protein 2 [Wenling sobemo-like virus 2]APG75957.1 hypothetical protein 2 [Wenling sobemo-like virus 2]
MEIPDDWRSDVRIDQAIDSLQGNSSPGVPFAHVPSNNILREKYRGQLVTLVKQRLDGNLPAFPIRLFVKPEWHKIEKLRQQRYRLISQVSVVDQVIDKLLVASYYDYENSHYIRQPGKVGWSYVGGGYKLVPRGWGYDRKAWDWSVPSWLLEDYEFFLENQITSTKDHKDWLRKRFAELYERPILQLSDGTLLQQLVSGVQKSGAYYTLNGNTTMQVLLHHATTLESGEDSTPMIALGDDTVQPLASPAYLEVLQRWVTLKEAVPNEFCGMSYSGENVEPVYQDKHAMNLAADLSQDTLLQYHLLYGQSTKLPKLRRLNALAGHPPVHQLWLSTIWG